MVSQNLPAGGGELFAMLLKTAQHREIALIEHRAAIPLDIARASALLLFVATVLRNGATGSEKRQTGGEKGIFGHWYLSTLFKWFVPRKGAGHLKQYAGRKWPPATMPTGDA